MDFTNSASVPETIRKTVLEHQGSKEALANAIIGIYSLAIDNEKKAWGRVEQKKIDKKLKKNAGCCFSLFCCGCFNGSVLCKFLVFALLFGFIVRFVQGVQGYFK